MSHFNCSVVFQNTSNRKDLNAESTRIKVHFYGSFQSSAVRDEMEIGSLAQLLNRIQHRGYSFLLSKIARIGSRNRDYSEKRG